MREILFRAKRLTDRKWTYGDFTEVVGDCPRILSNENATMYAVAPETVGQYTGLKDKNGKKIFEGDIVRNPETSDVGEIYFDTNTATFAIKFSSFIVNFCDYNNSDVEVICNIYDNPELIREEV